MINEFKGTLSKLLQYLPFNFICPLFRRCSPIPVTGDRKIVVCLKDLVKFPSKDGLHYTDHISILSQYASSLAIDRTVRAHTTRFKQALNCTV